MSRKRLSRRDFLKGGLGLTSALALGRFAPMSKLLAQDTELIGLWPAFDPLINASQPLFEQFGGQKGFSVDLRTVPFSDWDRTIRSTPMQQDPPDIMIIDGPNVLNYAVNGILRPLSDVFTEEDIADFLPGTRIGSFYNDDFYGPAANESSQALFYNKGITDKYNIDVPQSLEDAWTWEEAHEVFMEIQAKEREERGNDQFWSLFIGQGSALGAGTYTGQMLIRSNGEVDSPTFKAISDDGLTSDGYINTPEAIEALQFMQDLYVTDELVPSSESPDFFYNDQVAFWLSTPVYLNVIKERNPDLEWGVAPCPYHKTPIIHTDSFHLGVSAFSDNGDLAAELVAFMASPEGSYAMAEAQGVIPQRFSVLEAFPAFEEEPMRIFIDTVREWAYPRPVTPGFSEYDTIYSTMLTDIATGAPVEETVNAAAAEIDAQLEKYAVLMS